MTWIVQNLWLIPALPTVAAGISAFASRRNRVLAATLAIGSMSVSFVLSSLRSCMFFRSAVKDWRLARLSISAGFSSAMNG